MLDNHYQQIGSWKISFSKEHTGWLKEPTRRTSEAPLLTCAAATAATRTLHGPNHKCWKVSLRIQQVEELGSPVTMRFRVFLSIQETSCHLEGTMPLLSSYNHTGFRWSATPKVCGHTSCGHLWIHQFHPESPPARWFMPMRHCKWEQNFAWHSTNPTKRNDNLQNPQEGNPGLVRERQVENSKSLHHSCLNLLARALPWHLPK